jgi:mono/diheme cytochrome c family protein
MRALRLLGLGLGLVALFQAACTTGDPGEPGAKSTPEVVVEPVKIAADPAALGRVSGVAELPESFVVFGDKGAIVVQGGLPAASDDGVKAWSSAAAVAAPDGSGRWAIGVDDKGRLLRLREDSHIEEIGMRYGLAVGEAAKAIVKADESSFVIVLESAIVAVDTNKGTTKRFDTGPLTNVSAAPGRVAGVSGGATAIAIDLEAGKKSSFDAAGAIATTFDFDKHMLVLTEHKVLQEMPGKGDLQVMVDRPDAVLHGLASTPQSIWFGAGADLWTLEQSGGSKIARGVTLDPTAMLAGSASGDVWVLGNQLGRVKLSSGGGKEAMWMADVQPVYQNVCVSCHAPGGSAGIDLSTYGRWVERKALIRERVVEMKNMPPKPRELTPDQVAAIQRWTE